METKNMKLWDLQVPSKMLQSKPKLYKIMGMEAYYKKHKHFYGSIIVNTNYKILDGYVIFYTAKKLKVNDVPVRIVTKTDRIKFLFRKIIKKIRQKQLSL